MKSESSYSRTKISKGKKKGKKIGRTTKGLVENDKENVEEREIKLDNLSLNSKEGSVNPSVLNPNQIQILKDDTKNLNAQKLETAVTMENLRTNSNKNIPVVLNIGNEEDQNKVNFSSRKSSHLQSEFNDLISISEKKTIKTYAQNHSTCPEYDINNPDLQLLFASLRITGQTRLLMFQFNDISELSLIEPFSFNSGGKGYNGCQITRSLFGLIPVIIFLIIYNILIIVLSCIIKVCWLLSLIVIINTFALIFIGIKERQYLLLYDQNSHRFIVKLTRLFKCSKTWKIDTFNALMFYIKFFSKDGKVQTDPEINNYISVMLLYRSGIKKEVITFYCKDRELREEMVYLPGYLNHLLYVVNGTDT